MTAISERNRNIADTLTSRLLDAMADEVYAIVLFGSVARGDANEKSDIDLYIIAKDCTDTRRRMEAICAQVQDEFENVAPIHRLFTSIDMFETEASICRCSRTSNIINQGILLHDDGTFARIYEESEWEKYMREYAELSQDDEDELFMAERG